MSPSTAYPTPPLTPVTPLHHSTLLTLPPELLTQILFFLIQPKNNRIYLFIRPVPGLRHPPPRLILRLAMSEHQNEDQDEDEFSGESDSVNPFEEADTDDDTNDDDEAIDNYAQTRHTLFNPSTLTLNHLFHTLTLHHMHTRLLLHIKLGHQLAADITIRTRHCLRTTTKERQGLEAYFHRLRATLQRAGAFRRVLVSVQLWNKYVRTLPGQLDGILDALLMPSYAAPVSGLECSIAASGSAGSCWPQAKRLWSRRGFDVGASTSRTDKRNNYIIVDLQSWANLAKHNWIFGRRRGIAVDMLLVLTKWRKKEREIDGEGRLGVDIRGERSLPGWYVWKEEVDDEEDEIDVRKEETKLGLRGKRMKMVMEGFVEEFRGRMVVRGSGDWSSKGTDNEMEGDDGGSVIVV